MACTERIERLCAGLFFGKNKRLTVYLMSSFLLKGIDINKL